MALSSALSIAEISALLREMGEGELADRLDYLASDEDLEPGESPATDESARGSSSSLPASSRSSKVGLACSPEGWIVGEWRWFPDKRRASMWFLDAEQVMFTAKKKNGEVHVLSEERGNNITDRSTLNGSFGAGGIVLLASQSPTGIDLLPEHSVARYCRPTYDVKAESSSSDAFILRLDEQFLSTNWLEYFHDSDRQVQMFRCKTLPLPTRALTSISVNGRFASSERRLLKSAAFNDVELRFVLLGQASDPSHVGIYSDTTLIPRDIDIAVFGACPRISTRIASRDPLATNQIIPR